MHRQNSTFSKSPEKWMITITIMLLAILEVLDMTIVNVALPKIMGSLSTTTDQVTWVLTSYILTSAVFMLMTGYLDGKLGRRRLLLICIIGFMTASALSGLSTSLTEIIIFRCLQGMFGASLVPLSQATLRNTFSAAEQGKAMAIWGIGIMVAPILGPTIGGYIIQHSSWRWIFYINIPICVIAFFMALRYIKPSKKQTIRFDWTGAFIMSLAVISLQILLAEGNAYNWFQSKFIVMLALIFIFSLSLFIIRGWNNPNNIINFHLFRDRNFSRAVLMLILFSMAFLSLMAIQPILLENYLGYPSELTGIVMAPRGIAAAVGMMIIGGLMNKLNPRHIMFVGLLLAGLGCYLMLGYNLTTSAFYWEFSGVLQGLGLGLFMVPLSTLSLSTLPKNSIAEGAGLYSFGRNLGSSIGISILSTLIARENQINWHQLSAKLNFFNPNLKHWLALHQWSIHNPKALIILRYSLFQQSGIISFLDAFVFICLILLILMIPASYQLKVSH